MSTTMKKTSSMASPPLNPAALVDAAVLDKYTRRGVGAAWHNGQVSLQPRHNMEITLAMIVDTGALFMVLLTLFYLKIFPLEKTSMQKSVDDNVKKVMDRALAQMSNEEACALKDAGGPGLATMRHMYNRPDAVAQGTNTLWLTVAASITVLFFVVFLAVVLYMWVGVGVSMSDMLGKLGVDLLVRLVIMLGVEGAMVYVSTFEKPAFLGVKPSELGTVVMQAAKEDNAHGPCRAVAPPTIPPFNPPSLAA